MTFVLGFLLSPPGLYLAYLSVNLINSRFYYVGLKYITLVCRFSQKPIVQFFCIYRPKTRADGVTGDSRPHSRRRQRDFYAATGPAALRVRSGACDWARWLLRSPRRALQAYWARNGHEGRALSTSVRLKKSSAHALPHPYLDRLQNAYVSFSPANVFLAAMPPLRSTRFSLCIVLGYCLLACVLFRVCLLGSGDRESAASGQAKST